MRPKGLDFIVSRNAYIYISTYEGCRLEEAQPENLSFRQYEVTYIVKGSGELGVNFLRLIARFTGPGNWDVCGTVTEDGDAILYCGQGIYASWNPYDVTDFRASTFQPGELSSTDVSRRTPRSPSARRCRNSGDAVLNSEVA